MSNGVSSSKPRFSKRFSWVVIRPMIVDGDQYESGDALTAGVRTVRLRRWYKRGIIGPQGYPWTDMMVEAAKAGTRPIRQTIQRGQNEDHVAAFEASGLSQGAWMRLDRATIDLLVMQQVERALEAEDDDLGEPVIEAAGGGWFTVTLGDDTRRVRGKRAATKLAEEMKG